MQSTILTTSEELQQIIQLASQNLRTKISEDEKKSQGFVTWDYSLELLQKMNAQHPHVIVKDESKVIGYALVALKEARHFHPDLEIMTHLLEELMYQNKR